MGGKHKQAQRVKNNARPSSSGRSAERLGATVAPFAAFTTVKEEMAEEQLDPAVDPSFHLVLKKMNKKDGTTKLKALAEFRALVELSDAEAVALVASLWCRVYVGLVSGAEDGRVREAAHLAHTAVCRRAARSLAPHIRTLAAPWLGALHDPHIPAATAAISALNAAFPDERRRHELVARSRRHLLQRAIDVLVDGGDERTLSCSLRAAALALDEPGLPLPDEQDAQLAAQLAAEEHWWQLATVGGSQAGAWAALLAALCRFKTKLNRKRALRAALAALWGPAAAPADASGSLLDAVLQILPGEDHGCDLQGELVVPLCRRLAEPMPGAMAPLCAALLPLLAAMPISLAKPAAQNVLTAALQAMRHPHIATGRTELAHLAAAYMDCVQWAGAVDRLQECVRQTVDCAPRYARTVYQEIARLMRRWRGENADRAWNSLQQLVVTEISHVQQLADLVVCLSRPVTPPRAAKVTFAEDNVGSNPPPSPTRVLAQATDDLQYNERVEELVSHAWDFWLHECTEQPSDQIANALLTLVRHYNSERMWTNLTKSDNIELVYKERISPALDVAATRHSDSLAPLTELVFLLLCCVKDEEICGRILAALPGSAVAHAARLAQHHPHVEREGVSLWLRTSTHVHELYVRLAAGDSVDTDVLKRALQFDPPSLSESCLEEVVQTLRKALIDGAGQQSCEMAAAACQHAPIQLAPALLAVTCAPPDSLTPQIEWDVRSAWRDALIAEPVTLLPILVGELHVQHESHGCTDEVLTAAVQLTVACADPRDILGSAPFKIGNTLEVLGQHVVVAHILEGRVTAHESWASTEVADICPPVAALLAWQRLVLAVLERLLIPTSDDDQDVEFCLDYKVHEHAFDNLLLHTIYACALISCFAESYLHCAESNAVINELTDTNKLCTTIIEELSRRKGENARVKLAELALICAGEEWSGGAAWAACTAQLVREGLLGAAAGNPLRVADSWCAIRLAQAVDDRSLRPEQVPAAKQPSQRLAAARAVLCAAVGDRTALETATAEAVCLLRAIAEQQLDELRAADACWLLETALRVCSPPTDALLDMALVRVPAWSTLLTGEMYRKPAILTAYCRVTAAFHEVLQDGERRVEYEQLFAADVRAVLLHAYFSSAELMELDDGATASLVAWPLFAALQAALHHVLPGIASNEEEHLWRVSLRIVVTPCVPAQLCAHSCLRHLVTNADPAGERVRLIATDLANLQQTATPELDELLPMQHTAAYHTVFGYFLAWNAAAVLEPAWEQPQVDQLLRHVLLFIPMECQHAWFEEQQVGEGWGRDAASHSSRLLALASCRLYANWCRSAGWAVRACWHGLETGEARRVERLTARHVTRGALRAQLAATQLPGVACAAAGRLVTASYQLEDTDLRLTIELGEAWPVGGAAAARLEARPPPTSARLMQLSVSAAAAAPLQRLVHAWKDAVDRRYEGLPECHICFSLLHACSAQLPRLRCRTCRHHFHSACLYRWFSTSNKSTCPICRNLF